AVPVAIDPVAHDRLVALTSHVPHVLANVVVNQAGATRVEGHEPLANAGGSPRELARIPRPDPATRGGILPGHAAAVVGGEAEAQRAAELLESQGYDVLVSAVLDEG